MQTYFGIFESCQECRKARRNRIILENAQKSRNHHSSKKAVWHKKCKQPDLFQHHTKRLPLLQNQKATTPRDDLFVAIDDFSRELYAAIPPDRTAASAAKFLLHDVIDCCPDTVECAYSDNGVEYRGNAGHPFGLACVQNNIEQKFTRIARPQTNGKAERVIRTLMEMWHDKIPFQDTEHRQKALCRFVNFYNPVKPHKSLKGDTPFEVLQAYVNNPVNSYNQFLQLMCCR